MSLCKITLDEESSQYTYYVLMALKDRKVYNVRVRKEDHHATCTCEHGSLWRANKPETCWHIKHVLQYDMLREVLSFRCRKCNLRFKKDELKNNPIVRDVDGLTIVKDRFTCARCAE